MGDLDRPFELSDFSNDILSIIIEYIDDASDFLNVSMLSTRFNCLCKNEECSKPLWRKFYAKKWRMNEHELEKVSKRKYVDIGVSLSSVIPITFVFYVAIIRNYIWKGLIKLMVLQILIRMIVN